MKKKFLFASLIAVLFILIVLATPVNATSNAAVYGTVTSLTGSPSITDDDEGNIVIGFNKTQINNLKWVKHDDNGVERGKSGWWLGFRVTAPENADLDTSLWSGGKTSNEPFRQSIDSADVKYCSFWVPLDENILASHDTEWEAYKFTFNWKNRSDAQDPQVKTLTVTIKIDPEGAVLDTTPENNANSGQIVKVTVDGHVFRLTKGDSLDSLTTSEKTTLNNLKVKDGYTFDGFFKTIDGEDVEVKETDPINEDTVLISKFTKIESKPPIQDDPVVSDPVEDNPAESPAPQPAQQESPKVKDNTPKTGSVNVELIFSGMAILALIGTIIVKKYSK